MDGRESKDLLPAPGLGPKAPLFLRDAHGRLVRKLRLQLTDACNYRCLYCMPPQMRFLPAASLLSPAELRTMAESLFFLGLTELRVTGGEPTLRPDFDAALRALSEIPWSKFGLTSNGQLLRAKLPLLRTAGCRHLNISLDSLDAERFRAMTRGGDLHRVLEALFAALEMSFRVKVNVVAYKGINDGELLAFAEFSERHGVEVRFLELMKVGPGREGHAGRFLRAAEMVEELSLHRDLIPVPVEEDSTAFVYRTDRGGKIGFIASESKPFCGSCSRLRLSATGLLRACLFSEAGLPLRGVDPEDYPDLLERVLALKPTGRLSHILQPMNQIGG